MISCNAQGSMCMATSPDGVIRDSVGSQTLSGSNFAEMLHKRNGQGLNTAAAATSDLNITLLQFSYRGLHRERWDRWNDYKPRLDLHNSTKEPMCAQASELSIYRLGLRRIGFVRVHDTILRMPCLVEMRAIQGLRTDTQYSALWRRHFEHWSNLKRIPGRGWVGFETDISDLINMAVSRTCSFVLSNVLAGPLPTSGLFFHSFYREHMWGSQTSNATDQVESTCILKLISAVYFTDQQTNFSRGSHTLITYITDPTDVPSC